MRYALRRSVDSRLKHRPGPVAKALPTWNGKTIIDLSNAHGVPPEELGMHP